MKHEDMMQLVQGVLNIYSVLFNTSYCPHYEVIISKSIFDDRLKLCQSLFEQQEVYRLRPEIDPLNGIMVGPENDDRTYYLIISENRFVDQISYIGTVAHEFTHILDFYQYYSENNIINTRFIKSPDYNFAHFYSELRARYRGSLLSWVVQGRNKVDEVSFSQIIKQYDDILKEKISLYYIAQLYGQYLAVKHLDPDFKISLPKCFEEKFKPLLSLMEERIDDPNMYDNYNQIKRVYDELEGQYL